MNHHWVSDYSDDEILDSAGFVYLITNLATGKKYIGKKFVYSITRKKVRGRKNRKVLKSESNWRYYTSSSKKVNNDIISYGKDAFEFRILDIYKTRIDVNYNEVVQQINYDVLRSIDEDAQDYEFYNENILGKFFRR